MTHPNIAHATLCIVYSEHNNEQYSVILYTGIQYTTTVLRSAYSVHCTVQCKVIFIDIYYSDSLLAYIYVYTLLKPYLAYSVQ